MAEIPNSHPNDDQAHRDGDANAFDEAYSAFNTRLFTFLLRLSRRRDVAEDLLEETWLRLVKHGGRLRPDTRLGPLGVAYLIEAIVQALGLYGLR